MGRTPAGAGARVETRRARRTVGLSRFVNRAGLYALLAAGAIAFGLPFVWLVSTSLKPERDVFLFPPALIPSSFEWANYPNAVSLFPFVQGFRNTMIITLGVGVGRLLTAPLAAYGFARIRFP